ncbi:5-hydroxytryptamine receptor 1A-like [Apostichopus japonicus]|uniref:5-hydroxytryptamine receptor 1A-like n=1 Tax=Stichopus japonicus TaxID=307972 RepID=UPI003AB71C42
MENTTLLTTNDTGDMDPDTKLNCLQSTILLTIIVTAIVANLSVIIVILRNESLRRNSHNILILNLAVADLGTSIGSMLVSFIANFKGGWILSQHMWACSLNVSVSIVCYFGSFGAIISIALHRYLLVVQSNRFNVTITYSYVMIAISWAVAVILTVPSATGWTTEVVYIDFLHHCGQDWSENCRLSYFAIFFPYVLVIPLMIFCYTSIALEIRKSQAKINTFRQRVTSSIRRLTRRDRNLGIQDNIEISTSQDVRIEEDGATPTSQSSVDKRQGLYISDWDEYEKEYKEICYTLRRAGSMLEPSRLTTTKKSRFTSKSIVQKRDMKLRSFLGADKLVAIAGALVVMTTFVCWTPYSIVKVKLCDSTDTSQQIWIICRFLSYSNSAINPLIYSIFNRGLHTALVRGYIQFFKRIKSCCHA